MEVIWFYVKSRDTKNENYTKEMLSIDEILKRARFILFNSVKLISLIKFNKLTGF